MLRGIKPLWLHQSSSSTLLLYVISPSNLFLLLERRGLSRKRGLLRPRTVGAAISTHPPPVPTLAPGLSRWSNPYRQLSFCDPTSWRADRSLFDVALVQYCRKGGAFLTCSPSRLQCDQQVDATVSLTRKSATACPDNTVYGVMMLWFAPLV